jgi:hypothetical protein
VGCTHAGNGYRTAFAVPIDTPSAGPYCPHPARVGGEMNLHAPVCRASGSRGRHRARPGRRGGGTAPRRVVAVAVTESGRPAERPRPARAARPPVGERPGHVSGSLPGPAFEAWALGAAATALSGLECRREEWPESRIPAPSRSASGARRNSVALPATDDELRTRHNARSAIGGIRVRRDCAPAHRAAVPVAKPNANVVCRMHVQPDVGLGRG